VYYKLSNTAERLILEKEFGIPLLYGNLHKPARVINGLNEETVLTITSENQNHISPAIWGMLPEEYIDDWYIFQNISNTLNISGEELYQDSWKTKSLFSRRCLIVVTGFFTSYLHQGTICPYYVSRVDNRAFCIAGIYNQLEDGFLTCSILTQKADDFIASIHNLGTQMPMVLGSEFSQDWLDRGLNKNQIKCIIDNPCSKCLEAHLIAKELFNHNITYDSILEPVFHESLKQIVRP